MDLHLTLYCNSDTIKKDLIGCCQDNKYISKTDRPGKELSSLPIFKCCVCVWENRNIRGHQQYKIASDGVFG